MLIDGILVDEERDKILGHLAACSRCREVYTMASELAHPVTNISWRKVWYYASATAAVAVVAVLSLSIFSRGPASTLTQLAVPAGTPSKIRSVVAADKEVVTPSAPLMASRTEKTSRNLNPKKPAVVKLLTEEEATLQEAKDFGFAGDNLQKDGPGIKLISPDQDRELHSPVKLDVRFRPQTGSKVDLSSLRVECLKIINIDLTPRVRPYLTPYGIDMENVNIPAGNYRIRVSVADTKGNVTVEIFTLRVLF